MSIKAHLTSWPHNNLSLITSVSDHNFSQGSDRCVELELKLQIAIPTPVQL